MSENAQIEQTISEAHQRILDLAARCFSLSNRCDKARDLDVIERRLEEHDDACDALWDELKIQTKGVQPAQHGLKTNAQIEREVAREVRDRLRQALPDMIATALQE